MKHLRQILIGSALLSLASLFFYTSSRTPTPGVNASDSPSIHQASEPVSKGKTDLSSVVSQRSTVSPQSKGNRPVEPSPWVKQHFPEGRVLQSRLEVITANEFRRTEMVETRMKYPFLRVETRFRQEGTNEILLARHEVVADHVSVELKEGATEADLAVLIAPFGGTLRKKLNLEYASTYLVGLPEPGLDAVPAAIASLKLHENIVAAVDGDGFSRKALMPNDSRFTDLWHLHNTGQASGLVDADIDAAEAWSINTGSPNVVVAISDTGVNFDHPDLKDNIWTNQSERKNGLDDDRNSYRDDIRGWNFYNGKNDVQDTDGHGTIVAGIVGARGNNGMGVAGLSWNSKLMVLRVLDTNGGYNSDIAEGFDYARRMGAKIINASHGGTGSSVLKRAVDNLETGGVLLVAAAGNYGENTDHIPLHPASYPNANVVSVAATGRDDSLTSFSSFGGATVDLAAPGSAIHSTSMSGGYTVEAGTSFSVPQVTGVAALVLAQNPGWDCFKIKNRILNNVDKVPSLSGKCVTGGRLNAYKAILPKTTLVEALDGKNLAWSSTGSAPWIGGKVISHDGVDSAETGKVWHNEESRLQTTIAGPGKVSFWWKVSSELNYDFLIFYIDGSEIARISGQKAWEQRIVHLQPGNHTLTWKYAKDGSRNGGLDKGFVDQVIFLGVAPSISSQPGSQSVFQGSSVQFSVEANGTAPLKYQWRKNGVAIPGATQSSFLIGKTTGLDAGNYSVVVSNRAGSVTSAAAQLKLCTATLSSTSASFDSTGGTGNFDVSVSGGCDWSVGKTNDWINTVVVSSGATGTVQFSAEPNSTDYARASFLTIGNRRFLVRQAGVPAPATFRNYSIVLTVTNSSGSLPGNGSLLLNTSFNGEQSAFRLVPLSGDANPDTGFFSYTRNAAKEALLNLSGATSRSILLTFDTRSSGTFALEESAGNQTGFFQLRTSTPDLNGDALNDLLLQNTEGVIAAWCMNGTELLQALPLRNKKPAALGWKAVAAGDLLGESQTEIVLQGPNQQLAAWCFSEGTNFLGAKFLRDGIPLGAGWRVAGSGDFNQDGRLDLVIQHQDTRAGVWYMDGTNFLGAKIFRDGITAGAGWRIAGVADWDEDGESDILWQHQDGRIIVWHFAGSEFVAISSIRASGADWRIVAINDFNHDAKNDLLFLHKDRRMAIWFMDNTNFLSATLIRGGQPLGSGWRVVAPK